MKDSKGNVINIGDRVKVLWKFDNRYHSGNIVNIYEDKVFVKTENHILRTTQIDKIIKVGTNE